MTGQNPLRQRAFAHIWSAGLISDTGDWLLIIALPLYVFAATGSALSTATLFLAELLPALLLGSFAGVLADRWDPRRTMIAVNVAQALALLPLLVVDGRHLWIVFEVAGVEALLETLFTPAKQTLLRRLLDADQLAAGNTLIGVNENLARLVGSPLGGLAIALLGLRVTVLLDGLSYLVSAALILRASPPSRRDLSKQPATTAFFEEWVAGLALIRRSRPLRVLVSLGVAGQLAQGMFVVLFVVFVRRSIDGSQAELGLIRGLQAVGAVAGGIVVTRLTRRGRLSGRAMIGGGFTVFGAVSLVTWNAPNLTTAVGVYAGLFALAGIPAVALDSGLTTQLQLIAPVETLGRVVAAALACGRCAEAVGLLVAGAFVDRLGITPLLELQGSIYLACGLTALVVLRAPVRTSRWRPRGELSRVSFPP